MAAAPWPALTTNTLEFQRRRRYVIDVCLLCTEI
jgi:hypothetical protein